MAGLKREERNCRVVVLPTGPEDERPPEVLHDSQRESCVRYYEYLREQGDPRYEGRALVVIDGMGAPIYAS